MRRCAIACQLGVLDPRSPITEEGSTGGGLSARMIGPEKPGNSGVFRGRLCTLAGAGGRVAKVVEIGSAGPKAWWSGSGGEVKVGG
jgi:hypothetical protein